MVAEATINLDDEDNIISQRSQAMAPAATGSEESKFLVEVAVYLSLNRAKTSVDILQFWSENEKRLPISVNLVAANTYTLHGIATPPTPLVIFFI